MSFRYWHGKLAFILGVTVALTALARPPESTVEPPSSKQNEQRQAETNQRPPYELPVPLSVEIIENDTESAARKRRERESDQREIDDLLAQQGMEEATRGMADLAQYQTWLIGIGTALLLVTLWLTRQANKAATKAAVAAEEAVKVTRELGQAQIRAYLTCASADIILESNWLGCWATIRNSGSSPARDVEIVATISIYGEQVFGKEEDPLIQKLASSFTSSSIPIIAAGDSKVADFLWQRSEIGNSFFSRIFETPYRYVIDCKMTWSDVFGKKFTMLFLLRRYPQNSDDIAVSDNAERFTMTPLVHFNEMDEDD